MVLALVVLAIGTGMGMGMGRPLSFRCYLLYLTTQVEHTQE